MKRFILLFTLTLPLAFWYNSSFGQCNAELYSHRGMKKIAPGFLYEKSYEIDGRDGTRRKIEFPSFLSKGTNYHFTVDGKDGASKGIIMSIYNSRKERLASNYLNGKFFNGVEYRCKSTGLYYLTFTFKDSRSYCGAAVMAFRR